MHEWGCLFEMYYAMWRLQLATRWEEVKCVVVVKERPQYRFCVCVLCSLGSDVSDTVIDGIGDVLHVVVVETAPV